METHLKAPYAPVQIPDVLLAFPAQILHLMPSPKDIPDEYLEWRYSWTKFAQEWFSYGLKADVVFDLKDGINGELAVRHLTAVLRSYQCRHQEKIAAVAFLSSRWFTQVINGNHTYCFPEAD